MAVRSIHPRGLAEILRGPALRHVLASILMIGAVACAPMERPGETAQTERADPFTPKRADASAEELRAWAQWNEHTQKLSTDLIALIERLDEVDIVSQRMLEGDELPITGERKAQAILESIREAYAQTNQEVDALAPVTLANEKWDALSRAAVRHIQRLRDQVGLAIATTEKAVAAAARHDRSAYGRLVMRSLENAIAILNAENITVDLFNATLDPHYPQHALNESVKHANEALIAVLAFIKDGMPPGATMAYKAAVDESLGAMRLAISEGRDNIESRKGRVDQLQMLDPANAQILSRAFDTYYQSFDVEERIMGSLQTMTQEVFEPKQPSAVHEVLSRVEAEFGALVDQRARLQEQRTAMVGHMR